MNGTCLGMGLAVVAKRNVPLKWCSPRFGPYLIAPASAPSPASLVQERQAKMVDDLREAQKLVTELQAANAALTAKVECLQRAGPMEQGRGSRSGLGGAPGMWQVGRGLQDDKMCTIWHAPASWSRQRFLQSAGVWGGGGAGL